MVDVLPLIAGHITVSELSDEAVRAHLRHLVQVHRQALMQLETAYQHDRRQAKWLEIVPQTSPSST